MLCRTTRRLLYASNKLNTSYNIYTISHSILKASYGTGPRSEKLEMSERDAAVAIFEKITRTEALINLLSKDIGTELRQNIVLNPDRNSKLRHIEGSFLGLDLNFTNFGMEVTEDKIRLEYSQVTPQFTVSAVLEVALLTVRRTEVRVADASEHRGADAVPDLLGAE